jgi:soluble lytic murein transglycosylase-like protein
MNYLVKLLLLPLLVLTLATDVSARTKSTSQETQNASLPARSVAKFPQPRRRFQVTIPTEGSRQTGTLQRLQVSVKADGKDQRIQAVRTTKSSGRNRHQYRRDIVRIARKYRLDPVLIQAVISVESAFDPNAVSHKGAMGLMQLMPATAQRFGALDPYDPLLNIDAGTRYLRLLLEQFGDVRLALAAYNAGEGAVMRYGTIPPYRETREYVVKVLHHYDRYTSKYLIE